MPEYTYQEIDFRIPVRAGFYHYEQKVSPAYRVCGTGIDWTALVVHRIPSNRHDRWFVSEQTTGASIETPETTSKEEAAQHAITKIKELGQEQFKKALERTQKEKIWHNR